MNSYQLRILWLAIGIATMALMFPPWTVGLRHSISYQAFWAPPFGARVNSALLLIELGIVALLGAGAWVTAKDERVVHRLVLKIKGVLPKPEDLPSRKEFSGGIGLAAALVAALCGGVTLLWAVSGEWGTSNIPPVILSITLVALVLVGLTWRDFMDIMKQR